MKLREKMFFIILVLTLFFFVGGFGIKAEAQIKRLSIGTADTGGVYYIYGGGIAKVISAYVPNTQATAEVTPGAVDNVKMLQNKSLDLAFTKSDIASDALRGVGPFEKTGKVQVRIIAATHADIAHVVVGVNSGIDKLEDMKGKRISTSAPGSGHEIVAMRLLEAANVNIQDIKRERVSLSESVNAFKDRKIDGFFFATGLPAASMLDLSATPGISFKILDVQSYLKKIAEKHGPVYIDWVIPKGTYSKLENDVKTIAVPVVFVTTEDVDAKLVYEITKTMFEKKAELVAIHKEARKLTLENAIAVSAVPYHPGAIKYYKEQRVWK
jgi:TRAP transporter TAXI family solute receptor